MKKANDEETSTISEEIDKYEYLFGPDQWDADGVDHIERIKKLKNGYLIDMGDGTYGCVRPE